MLRIRSRATWRALPPDCSVASFSTPAAYTFIHHSVTPTAHIKTVEAEKAHMRYLQQIAFSRGFCDISYSFIIFPSGRVYEGRGWKKVGAHTEGYNSVAHAFCFAGNFETQAPSRKALEAAGALHKKGVRWHRIARNAVILGHRQAQGAATACPGKHLYDALGAIRKSAR